MILILFSSIVIIFSKWYFHNISKEFFINFVIFMIRIRVLIIGNSLITVLWGWEGLGLFSFLLIRYFSTDKTFVRRLSVIRWITLGDSLLMGFIFLFLIETNNIKFNYFINGLLLTFLIFGICIKSAIFPSRKWLILAIQAPTPVSTLVHRSTLVVAPFFFLTKLLPTYVWRTFRFFFFISCLGVFYRRIGLFFKPDFKEGVAYSTLLNLNFILIILIIRIKLNLPFIICYFFIWAHAGYKISLFIINGFYYVENNGLQNLKAINVNINSKLMYLSFFLLIFSSSGFFHLRTRIIKHWILIYINNGLIYLVILLGRRSFLYFLIKILNLFFIKTNILKLRYNNLTYLFITMILSIFIGTKNVFLNFNFDLSRLYLILTFITLIILMIVFNFKKITLLNKKKKKVRFYHKYYNLLTPPILISSFNKINNQKIY